MTRESRGVMDRTALRLGVDELNAAYSDCIDDDRLEEWPNFFVEQGRYLITDRESHRAGLRHGVVYCASRDMAIDRVMATRHGLMYEPHRYRHIVGPSRIDRVKGGVAEARANFLAVRIIHSARCPLVGAGRYLDRIGISGPEFKFFERPGEPHSHGLPTL